MKKTIIATATILLSVFLLSSAGYSEYALRDRIADGTYIIAKSQLLKEKGEMLKAYKDQDKAWLVDQGHLIVKEGSDIVHRGMTIHDSEGQSSTQELGMTMMGGGNLLLKMGRKKDALTEKDKKKIIEHGEMMIKKSTHFSEKGKIMGGK